MEDTHLAMSNIIEGHHLFGVFDGHGGIEVAQFVKENFIEQLKELESFKEKKFETALTECFIKMDRLCGQQEGARTLRRLALEQRQNPGKVAERGCAANVVLITPDEIYCANAGDCRAVLSRNGGEIPLSKDHKPKNEEEKKRIKASGGHVRSGRVNNKLNVSRAIGDFYYKD